MARHNSDSDSDRSSSRQRKSKKKSKSKHRSSSYDGRRSRHRSRSVGSGRGRRSKSREDRRYRRRSSSDDSYSPRRSHHRSKSRSRTPRRYRGRSRTESRERDRSRKGRSRSGSRERSSKSRKKKKSKKTRKSLSPKREAFSAFSAFSASSASSASKVTSKDPFANIIGASDMAPAELSRLRVQASFKAAESSAKEARSESPVVIPTAMDQMDRAQVIDDIEDVGFMPSRFKSSRSAKAKEASSKSWQSDLIDQEDYHEMAIFGSSSALGLDERAKKEISEVTEKLSLGKKVIRWEERDLKTLAHPNLNITHEEAEKRWADKLRMMRKEKMKERSY